MPGFQPRHDTDPVWFGDQQINNLLVASQQTGVRLTAIHGWDDRPDVRDVRELRSGQDGEYADNLYLGGRTITVEGEVYGSSWVDLQARKRVLAALFQPASTESVLKVPDPATAAPGTVWSASGMTGYERASVRVVEAIQFGDTLDPACQVWQVVLRASDPRVYSDVEVSTDSGTSGTATRSVAFTQSGTYRTGECVVQVTGPTSSAWVVSAPQPSGEEIRIVTDGLPVADGAVVSLDTRDRTATLTGDYDTTRTVNANLVAGYMLEETSGTTADNIQGLSAIDGTYTGGYTLNQSGFTAGRTSVALNGSTGYVAIPYDASLYSSTFSFECRVRFTSLASTQVLADSLTSNTGWRFWFDASTLKLNVSVGRGAATVEHVSPVTSLAAGEWYHLAIGFGSLNAGAGLSAASFYINGEFIGTSLPNTFGHTSPVATGMRLGSTLAGGSYLGGSIGQAFLYSDELTPTEVLAYSIASSSGEVSVYGFLDAQSSRWGEFEAGSQAASLASTGLNTGSKLNITSRAARV